MYLYNVRYTKQAAGLNVWGMRQVTKRQEAQDIADELNSQETIDNLYIEEVLPGTRCAHLVWPENYTGRRYS